MDSRSAKTSHRVDSDCGIDGDKKIKGRKEHIIVDALDLSLVVAIHEANLHVSKGVPQAIEELAYNRVWLKHWRTKATEETCLMGRRNPDGHWKLLSGQMNVRPSFKYCLNAGLWNVFKNSED